MEDNKVYFVVVLINGTAMDFDCKCNYIENTSPNMCLFLHKKEEDGGYSIQSNSLYKKSGEIKDDIWTDFIIDICSISLCVCGSRSHM